MPPRRSSRNKPVQKTTLGRFFAVSSTKPPDPASKQHTLDFFFARPPPAKTESISSSQRSSTSSTPGETKKKEPLADVDPKCQNLKDQFAQPPDFKMDSVSDSDSDNELRLGSRDLPIVLSDSGSDDELVDAQLILGGTTIDSPATHAPTPARDSVPPPGPAVQVSRMELRSRTPTMQGRQVSGTPGGGLGAAKKGGLYKNSLKSLVRAKMQRKYDLDFLEEQVNDNVSSGSDDEADSASPLTGEAVEGALQELPQEDIERIRAQLGANGGSTQAPMRLELFMGPGKVQRSSSSIPSQVLPHVDWVFHDIVFSRTDPVERLCAEKQGDARFFRRLVGSPWISRRVHRGWKLTQSIGDLLLRAMCLDQDSQLAQSAYECLSTFLDLQMSCWELQLASLIPLMDELQGSRLDNVSEMTAAATEEEEEGQQQNAEHSQDLDVVVEIIKERKGAVRASADRITYLMDVASKSLSFLSVEDSSRVLILFVESLLDFRNQMHRVEMQSSLARFIDRVSPPCKWTLMWAECVSRLAHGLSHLRLQSQLRIVECLPIASKRCMQVRRSLSYLFLRLQSVAQDEPVSSLAVAAALPGQIVLRVVGEMMDTCELFKVEQSMDFARLEAAIGLLSNVLDDVQAMRDVLDEVKVIYQRLCTMNQRINDRKADNIEMTLAKDAIQTLLVRMFMTAISDAKSSSSGQQPFPHSGGVALDRWLSPRSPHKSSADAVSIHP
ncbi:hypothetical protein GQ54DRAFT_310291 [Martensiomyces pterosporus]|nr:hypothetical protein GQ54DRAFT_310291 [Martensiomyces pterosporus]